MNNGAGAFPGEPIAVDLGEGTRPSFVTTGDIDGDGGEDIVILSIGANDVVAFMRETVAKGVPGEVQIGSQNYIRRDFVNIDVNRPLSAFLGDINSDSRWT